MLPPSWSMLSSHCFQGKNSGRLCCWLLKKHHFFFHLHLFSITHGSCPHSSGCIHHCVTSRGLCLLIGHICSIWIWMRNSKFYLCWWFTFKWEWIKYFKTKCEKMWTQKKNYLHSSRPVLNSFPLAYWQCLMIWTVEFKCLSICEVVCFLLLCEHCFKVMHVWLWWGSPSVKGSPLSLRQITSILCIGVATFI